jgi:hypothetical protein
MSPFPRHSLVRPLRVQALAPATTLCRSRFAFIDIDFAQRTHEAGVQTIAPESIDQIDTFAVVHARLGGALVDFRFAQDARVAAIAPTNRRLWKRKFS